MTLSEEKLRQSMGILEKSMEQLNSDFRTLNLDFRSLQIEFRWFRNIMVALYLTIVAPLVVAIFMSVLGKH